MVKEICAYTIEKCVLIKERFIAPPISTAPCQGSPVRPLWKVLFDGTISEKKLLEPKIGEVLEVQRDWDCSTIVMILKLACHPVDTIVDHGCPKDVSRVF